MYQRDLVAVWLFATRQTLYTFPCRLTCQVSQNRHLLLQINARIPTHRLLFCRRQFIDILRPNTQLQHPRNAARGCTYSRPKTLLTPAHVKYRARPCTRQESSCRGARCCRWRSRTSAWTGIMRTKSASSASTRRAIPILQTSRAGHLKPNAGCPPARLSATTRQLCVLRRRLSQRAPRPRSRAFHTRRFSRHFLKAPLSLFHLSCRIPVPEQAVKIKWVKDTDSCAPSQ
ncbi:hypothetical protein K438DRAFT_1813597 [Mycena galopus ATCC 62051]|nr:hypothetical protein K438DRAFT_1813597 [Mycena galopus ATCC 62051]